MRGKWLLISGVVILLAIAAGAIGVWRQDHARRVAAAAAKKAPVQQALPPGAEISLSGKVQAQMVVPVAATAEGTVEIYHVEVGHEVYEGQLLATIRNTQLESARDAATLDLERSQGKLSNVEGTLIPARLEASRAAADASRAFSEFQRLQKIFQRQQMLMKEGAIPRLVFEKTQKEFAAAQAEHDSARDVAKAADERVAVLAREAELARTVLQDKMQELDQAKSDLAATEVRSPVDGILIARKGDAGTEVTRDVKDFLQIATDLGQLQVVVDADPSVLPRIEPGMPAFVFVSEVNNEPILGLVTAIKGTQAIVDFQSPSEAIRPGLTAQVRIKIK